jgi:hypothetical protein
MLRNCKDFRKKSQAMPFSCSRRHWGPKRRGCYLSFRYKAMTVMIFQLDMFDLSGSSLCPCYWSLIFVHYLCGCFWIFQENSKIRTRGSWSYSVSNSFEQWDIFFFKALKRGIILLTRGAWDEVHAKETNYFWATMAVLWIWCPVRVIINS